MKLSNPFFLCFASLLISCAEPSLQERLAGKAGAEREREAYWACLEHARDGSAPRSEKRHLWAICDELHATNESGGAD